ncbi:hypothetical protein ACB092_08G015800 [Castanea dentata]
MEGKVKLPLLKKPPPLLNELLDPLGGQRSKTFRTQIRSYNAMFAMTSMGGKVDNRVNDGRGPYIFRLHGQTHHRIGTLLPNNGEDPQFAQLYFDDTENEFQHRMNAFSSSPVNKDLDPSIVDALIQMFNESNNLVKIFRMSRDRFLERDIHHLRLRLIGGLHRINELPPSYMALQYPLLFPYGEDGFRLGILGDTTPASAGKRIVLPLSFIGSPRYMIENYQDAMAICRWASYPDLRPGQKIEDRLDVLLYNLKHVRHFGRVIAGLPHAHILLFLHNDDKHPTIAEIDKIISAEIPDLNKEPLAYDAVKQYMVHGPCGSINSRASCMIENKRVKHFPKKVCSQTTVDNDGFPIYRRNNGTYVERNGVKLDNRFIVPHNIDLLSIKYLFKYITKGPDRATLILEENLHVDASIGMQNMTDTDEVKGYLNCRYVSAIETCWRIFELSFHIENQQPDVFKDSEYLDDVIDRPEIRKSKITEWMKANELYEEARELTYSEFPTKWVWHKRDKEWRLRKSGRCIGRIYYAYPASGECFYLRMLLNVVKGARSFKEVRTINNVVYSDFRSACYALGLLDDDKEWHKALNHASHWASGKQLRELFATMLIFCERLLSEDILYRHRVVLRYDNLHLDDFQLQNYALKELDYDRDSLAVEHIELFNGLNIDQRNIYDVVIDSVLRNKEGKIVIAVASSGIAALLLPGGRTAHSRFQIPIIVTGSSTCGIKQGSQIAELMTKATVDRSLRDILHFTGSDSANKPFGGKTIVLGGDFRQILPVVAKGRREQIVEAPINKSSLWNNCRVFVLTKNIRLTQNPCDIAAREFAEWILKVGDGELNNSESEALIEIPHDLLIQPGSHPFNDIMNATYPDFHTKFNDSKYLEEREILAPRNEVVEDINDYMIDLINVDEETYLSADSICKASTNILNQDVMYPTEFLNSLKVPGIPNHKLRLKLSKWVLEAQIILGSHVGDKVFIPRIVLSPSESKWPFVLKRRQFPVSVCFAMTINKSQGQSLKCVGLYLDKPVFCHGQLYVAVSRVTSRNGLRVLIAENDNDDHFHTKNIVYKKIFNDLPRVRLSLMSQTFHMNMEYTTLKEISRDKENLKVKVRVLRMWDAVNIANDHDLISLDMILVDKEVNS